MTPGPALPCPHCKRVLGPEAWIDAGHATCPTCDKEFEFFGFPALTATAEKIAPQTAVLAADSVCFFHAENRAEAVCDGCGRYLCGLCDVPLGDAHYCPSCLETGKRKPTAATLDTQRTLWDQIALSLAVLPMLIFYLTIITAPIAIVLGIRHWKTPGSLVRRSRWRFVVAIGLGAIQLVGMALLIVGLVAALRSKAAR